MVSVELAILSLRKKIFLFTAVVVVIVFPTALYLVLRQIQAATLRDAEHRIAAVAHALQGTTHERVLFQARDVESTAQIPALAAALARHDKAAIRQIVHDQHL